MSTVKMIDSTGIEKETLDLGFKIEGQVSPETYACAIRVLLQNWRQGTVSCKARSDVSFSGKKPWRQKGTGRARAGSAKSPIWRKGGVTFGPSPRVRTLKMSRKQRKSTLKALLKSMLDSNKIYCLDYDFGEKKVYKTKDAYNLLKQARLEEKKGILFLPYADVVNFASFRNIPKIGLLSFDQPNCFDLSGTKYWMFLKKDINLFKDMVEKWI
jgi:large subunit ribosomal protein L4